MKNPKRDEKGNPILSGARTFNQHIRPKGGKRQPRYFQYKDRAADRLLHLMKGGTDKFALSSKLVDDQEVESIELHNKLAEQNKTVQFAYHYSKLRELQEELKELIASNNKRKIELLESSIRREIADVEKELRELAESIEEGE